MKMIKKNFGLIVLTAVIILLPIIAGLIMWNDLPEQIPTHWNAVGEVDGWSGKTFAVFGLPLFILAVHIVCILATAADPRNKNIAKKPLTLVLWICPIISVLCNSLIYCAAFEIPLSIENIMPLFFGALFVIVGNYMPKCKQNYSIGIKLPWTLNDEENWNRTHRLAGKLWVAGGFLEMMTAFFGGFILFFIISIAMIIIPTVYSYVLYKKTCDDL